MRTESVTEKNIAPAIVCTAPWRVIRVQPLENYTLEVEFMDGTQGLVNMKQRISSPKAGVFAKLSDITFFNQVYLKHGVVTWPDEIDLAPDAMHNAIKHNGKWALK